MNASSNDDVEDGSASAKEQIVVANNTGATGAPSVASATDNDDGADVDVRSAGKKTPESWHSGWRWDIVYLSLFSTLGVTVRAFSSRFFGGDCESNAQGRAVDDWLWPLSHRICVTTSGETEQYGGALFLDLPANMIGSFIMGFMTGHRPDLPALPWLSSDHPLQNDSGLHVGIRTALCGTLTTFSSWNSQMVLMMDGTANPYLRSQVIAALFGYIIGMQAALASYRSGRTVAAWFHFWINPSVFDSGLSRPESRRMFYYDHIHWIAPAVVSVTIATIIVLYMLGDFYWDIAYYRLLWIACLTAPFGTIARWKLSSLNAKYRLPIGTFLANFIGSILSASLTAWATVASDSSGAQRWEIPVIKAISLGVAGSLSTVSSFAKECVEMAEKNSAHDKKQYLYSHGTMISCCFVGLLVYSPIVRYA